MRILVASMVAISGAAGTVHGQAVMRLLVSTDGVNFQSSVNAAPGSHVDVLVTASYTGTLTTVAGFGSADFQPTVSHWNDGLHPDQLDPILQGGNVLGSMINAQAAGLGLGSPNPYLNPTPGVNGGPRVPAAPYSPGTYGRVYPMGRTYENTNFGGPIVGFVHHNPDGSGLTYLRISQSGHTDWFNPSTNDGGGGVDAAQLYVVGRSSNDPDFWGNRDLTYDPGDPDEGTGPGYVASARIPANDSRLQNIQLFRFGIDLSTDAAPRTLVVNAPILGQQSDQFAVRYMSFFVSPFTATATLHATLNQTNILTGAINVVPSPGALGVVGVCALLAARRRRAGDTRSGRRK